MSDMSFGMDNFDDGLKRYCKTWFKIDQHYRNFSFHHNYSHNYLDQYIDCHKILPHSLRFMPQPSLIPDLKLLAKTLHPTLNRQFLSLFCFLRRHLPKLGIMVELVRQEVFFT